MTKWRKSPEELAATFHGALPADPSVVRRQMFGYPAAFVDGNMATGLHQEDLVVRLPAPRRQALLGTPGARIFEPMPGRPMKEYVVVPPAVVAKPPALRGWISEALAYAATLPSKKKNKNKSKNETAVAGTKPEAAAASPSALSRASASSTSQPARRR
jgi:hypothetical protein